MRVQEAMTTPVVVLSPEASIGHALHLMMQKKYRRLPLCQHETLVGIVTRGDIERHLLRFTATPSPELLLRSVSECMSRVVVSVGPAADITEAARIMQFHQVGGCPVVDEGRVIGLLTRTDLFKSWVDLAHLEEHGPGALALTSQSSRDLEVLNAALMAATRSMDVSRSFRDVVQQLREALVFDLAVLVLKDASPSELVHYEVFTNFPDDVSQTRVYREGTMSSWVLDSGKTLLVPDLQTEVGRYPNSERYLDHGMRSFIVVPLLRNQHLLGTIKFGTTSPRVPTHREVQLLEHLGTEMAQALHYTLSVQQARLEMGALQEKYQVLEDDLKAAQDAQLSLLPPPLPRLPGVQFAWRFLASHYVSGDALNVFHIDDDHIGFYLMDVVGHGVPAVMLSVSVHRFLSPELNTHSPLRTLSVDDSGYRVASPSQVVETLNQELRLDATESFFTLFYGIFNTKTRTLSYCRAGAPPALRVGPDGTCRRLEVGGGLVGMTRDMRWREETIRLAPGERVVVVSDGVIEAEDDQEELYSLNRIESDLADLAAHPLTEALTLLEQRVRGFQRQGRFEDDFSLLALEVHS